MPKHSNFPELSVIVPVLNEEINIQGLFASLTNQIDIRFEVVLSDGGSCDNTLSIAEKFGLQSNIPVRCLKGESGRGKQMNAGVVAAKGDFLLFLHADCRFGDPLALARGTAALKESMRHSGHRIAGRYALRFLYSGDGASLFYAFYETKARLSRPGCIHGDQGMLIPRKFFEEVGPFDESLPYLEDERFANAVWRDGRWIVLPSEIHTSARRFETEGHLKRQILNALIMNFNTIGWDEILAEMPILYRIQTQTGTLCLSSSLDRIQQRLSVLPWSRRLGLWYHTGAYVRGQAWQLVLGWKVWRRFQTKTWKPDLADLNFEPFDRWFNRLTDHPPGRLFTTFLVWTWFHLLRYYCRWKK